MDIFQSFGPWLVLLFIQQYEYNYSSGVFDGDGGTDRDMYRRMIGTATSSLSLSACTSSMSGRRARDRQTVWPALANTAREDGSFTTKRGLCAHVVRGSSTCSQLFGRARFFCGVVGADSTTRDGGAAAAGAAERERESSRSAYSRRASATRALCSASLSALRTVSMSVLSFVASLASFTAASSSERASRRRRALPIQKPAIPPMTTPMTPTTASCAPNRRMRQLFRLQSSSPPSGADVDAARACVVLNRLILCVHTSRSSGSIPTTQDAPARVIPIGSRKRHVTPVRAGVQTVGIHALRCGVWREHLCPL